MKKIILLMSIIFLSFLFYFLKKENSTPATLKDEKPTSKKLVHKMSPAPETHSTQVKEKTSPQLNTEKKTEKKEIEEKILPSQDRDGLHTDPQNTEEAYLIRAQEKILYEEKEENFKKWKHNFAHESKSELKECFQNLKVWKIKSLEDFVKIKKLSFIRKIHKNEHGQWLLYRNKKNLKARLIKKDAVIQKLVIDDEDNYELRCSQQKNLKTRCRCDIYQAPSVRTLLRAF